MSLYLGPCVALRRRSDGTVRVRFEVRRNRPVDWKPSIPILVNGRDGCVLESLDEKDIQAISRRAEDLYRQLDALRGEDRAAPLTCNVPEGERTWRRLIQLRREHGVWQDLSRESQKTYASTQNRILEIFGDDLALAPSVVLDDQIDRLVRARIASRSRRRAIMLELRILIRTAMRQGWRTAEKDIKFYGRRPTPGFQIWRLDQFRNVFSRCLVEGEDGLARLLVTQWEIGQRLRSVRNFRYGREYRDGTFFYYCVKTGAPIYLDVLDQRHRALLDSAYREGDYMFPRALDGKPFCSRDLSKTYARIRGHLPDLDPKLQLRYLRHTVIVQLATAGCTIPEIASVTGHQMQTVHRVLEHYLPRLPELARSAKEKLHNRRQLEIDGVTGSLIVENSRRIFIGAPKEDLKPRPPRALAYRDFKDAEAHRGEVRS